MVSDGTVQPINVNHHVHTVGRTIKLEICLTHLFSAKFHGINLAILLLLNLFFCYYSVCEETDTYADWYCKIET